MYSSNAHSNPWADYTQQKDTNLDELRKSIREQQILLDATIMDIQDYQPNATMSLEELKQRIISVSNELNEKQQLDANRGHSTQTTAQWWSRYQNNLRQLEDLSDQRQTLIKEIHYLINTGVKSVQDELMHETEKLGQLLKKNVQIKKSVSSCTLTDYDGLSDSDRIKAKAQAMVAARLKKYSYSSSSLALDDRPININTKLTEMNQLIDDISHCKADIESIMSANLNKIEEELAEGTKQLKERQMFEQGLYIDDQVARFIDQLDKTNSPPIPPPFASPSKFYTSSFYSSKQAPPPPVPTSQRPGTPRSADSIKAEAHRRIEERKQLFLSKDTATKRTMQAPTANQVTDEEKAAQERMRQAEVEARARLEALRDKRNKLRQEAAEAEEKKQKAAAEAAAAAEAEMLAEKRRKQLEEEERLAKMKRAEDELAEKRQKEQEAALERLRLEKKETLRKEAEEQKKREEQERIAEEERQKKAKKAAEQAAHEKRLRRIELEKHEKELEAARQEEINRRKQWEESKRLEQLEEEKKLKEQQEEARKLRQRLEEEQKLKEEQEKKRVEEEARLEQQRIHETEKKLEEERLLAKEQRKQQELADKKAEEEAIRTPPLAQASTTAGTSGYGIDIEDEVNFSIIYRVNTLYEYQGIREDDLSFFANETLKAHPSKDKGSDWWYGTSLNTNQVGFFPRTYVEVIEEAFRVRTLYEFQKTRDDDLGFFENEVIVVQPFQDDKSDWWYGTNEDTQESGYFPKTYVEKIDSTEKKSDPTVITAPIPIQKTSHSESIITLNDLELPRGLSAPNTPVMKKTNLSLSKSEMTKRRRAASNVSTASNSHISTPRLVVPHHDNASENLELLTWASTMDPIELEAIPQDERKRQEAIFELIVTERTYLNDLQMIINVFYTDCGKYLSQDERDVVFSNIDNLLICNTSLLSDMETRQRESANVIDNIGDVFLTHADSLKCYSSYCKNQSYATKFLQKKRENDQWFDVFLKTAQTRPECRSLDLSHFLLEPVQRITRYPLLLRQILNCTPRKHADYALVRSALSVAQRVLEDVNEETRRYENNQKMSELSRIIDMEATGRLNIVGREFVMDGILFKAKSGRKLHGYLFNDILILAEPLKQLSTKGYLYSLYREPLPLERVSVRQQQSMTMMPSFSNNNNTDDLTFQIVTGTQVIAVKTSTASQKRQWMSQIQHYSAYQQYN